MPCETRRSAGWYDDETDAALLRYWDGAGWSPHTAPRPGQDSSSDQLEALFRDAVPTASPALSASPVPGESVGLGRSLAPGESVAPGAALAPGESLQPEVTATVRLRAPDEHTTVPLPDEPAAPPPRRRRRRVGGHR